MFINTLTFVTIYDIMYLFIHIHLSFIYLFQLTLALRYLHKEKGIVHRDLTPNNIMLGENDKVTISKF